MKLFVVVALVCLGLGCSALILALTPLGGYWGAESNDERIPLGVVGGVFALTGLLCLVGTIVAVRRPSGIGVASDGIWYIYRRDAELVPWGHRDLPARRAHRGHQRRLPDDRRLPLAARRRPVVR